MIIETIVTTVDAQGAVNIAPMGLEWSGSDAESPVLKPFLETVTYRNVVATGVAVVNITDDVRVFAQAAISSPSFPVDRAVVVDGFSLRDACSWRELRVKSIDSTAPRSRMETEIVHHGFRREFVGFNRASHAVLETAIYATRVHLLARDFLEAELLRLQVIVDKTAGPAEREAMALLANYIRSAPPVGIESR